MGVMRVVMNVVALRDEILAAIIRHKESGFDRCKCGVPWENGIHIENVIQFIIDERTADITEVL